jgi:hypothetical protein
MTAIRYIFFCMAALVLAVASACQQQAQLPEYRAYTNDHDVPRITVEEAKKDVDSGIAVIVDSRPDQMYQSERIAGSINVPSGPPGMDFSMVPRDKKIIVYCS